MIRDPGPWTKELRRAISRCERSWLKYPQASEEWLALEAEKAVFLSAFIIRKLMDSSRLLPAVKNQTVPVSIVGAQRSLAELPRYLSWHDAHEYYDFDTDSDRDLPLRDLVNRLIHSYAFLVVGAYDGGATDPAGFYFNSDENRRRELLYINWDAYKIAARLVEHGASS